MKTTPRKPSDPLVSVGLAAPGGPNVDVKRLPAEIGAIEVEIGHDFASALSAFGIAAVSAPSDGEPADSLLRIAGGTVAVQHVEVVDAQRKIVQNTRDWYAARVTELVRQISPRIPGVEIRLDDGMCWEEWPKPSAKLAWQLVDLLAFNIIESRSRLSAIEPGYQLIWQFHTSFGAEFELTATRRPDGLTDEAIVVHSVHSWDSDAPEADGLLAAAIHKKLGKGYSRPRAHELWLLAYGPRFSVGALERAHEVLKDAAQSPFARVWTMERTIARSGLTELWPTPSWERTGLEPDHEQGVRIAEFSPEDGIMDGIPVARVIAERRGT